MSDCCCSKNKVLTLSLTFNCLSRFLVFCLRNLGVVKTLVPAFLRSLFMKDGMAEQPRKWNKNASTCFLNLSIPKSCQLLLDLQC